jgi:hypothetical protein
MSREMRAAPTDSDDDYHVPACWYQFADSGAGLLIFLKTFLGFFSAFSAGSARDIFLKWNL